LYIVDFGNGYTPSAHTRLVGLLRDSGEAAAVAVAAAAAAARAGVGV